MRIATVVLVGVLAVGCADSNAGSDGSTVDASGGDGSLGSDAMGLADASAGCDEGVFQVVDSGRCYMYFADATSWTAARALCEALGSGAQLATVTDADENSVIAVLIAQNDVWLAGNDLVVEGTFEWLTAEPMRYTNWRAGEPNDGDNNEDCMLFEGTVTDQWDDRPCSNNHARVCER